MSSFFMPSIKQTELLKQLHISNKSSAFCPLPLAFLVAQLSDMADYRFFLLARFSRAGTLNSNSRYETL